MLMDSIEDYLAVRRAAGFALTVDAGIRHRFAVRALECMGGDRRRIAEQVLALSTYLGHAHVADTYWYLHATPQLMRNIADACAGASGGVAP